MATDEALVNSLNLTLIVVFMHKLVKKKWQRFEDNDGWRSERAIELL